MEVGAYQNYRRWPGGLDIVVNNAGFTRYIAFDDLEAVTRESWDSLMSANVYGQFNVGCRAAILRGSGGPTGPLRTPSRTPWTLSR
jgi:NAD(P)-dependent dehydrogenase (short-subunit alcohol dehydrogenase family)